MSGLKELCQAVEDTHEAYVLTNGSAHAGWMPALEAYCNALGVLGDALGGPDMREAAPAILTAITEAEERGRREGLLAAADIVDSYPLIDPSEELETVVQNIAETIRCEVTP